MGPILVPIDFSGVTRTVVTEAIRLASRQGGKIALAHVLSPPGLGGSPDAVFTELAPLLESMRSSAADQMDKWKAFVNKRYAEVDTYQLVGYPALEISRLAKKLGARYIIVGSHGHTGFYDLLIGSTTSGILSKSTCPVVVVRQPPPKKP